jgi:GR25 family glycosyltransferase involved in LPS biosynthesis
MKLYFFLTLGFSIGLLPSFYIFINFSTTQMNFMKSLNVHSFHTVLTDNHFQYAIGSDELSSLAAHLFPRDKQYYYNYTSYDFYSVHDIGQSKPRSYWNKFSLDSLKQYPHAKSQSGLAFVESIMVITGKHLKIRHEHIEKVLLRQGIHKSTIEYRWKWNQQNCADPSNVRYFKSKFPYISGDHIKDVSCAVVIEHIDAWYSIAEGNLSFALILEDDVAFVPFLKEKFNRFMAEAVKLELIKVGKNQNDCSDFINSKNITMDQLLKNPILTEGVFHFGKCLNIPTPGMNSDNLSEVPRFSPYRNYSCGRCAHMYGMTHCAAKMMINALHKFPTRYQWADWLINHIITNSPKLISWWTDPPLGYQTSQIEVIGELSSLLKQRTYNPDGKAPVP